MKLFTKKIFSKFKIFCRSIFFFRYNHKRNVICVNNSSIIFNNVPIINIENDIEWNLKSEKSELISSLLQKDTNETDYPLIESWIKLKNRTFAPNNFFINQQYKNIYPNLNKNNLFYKKKIYVLPHYTSVFGHFAGDILGNLLYYLNFKVKKNKLLAITPSKFWEIFLEEIFPNKIYFIKPKIALKYNIIFANSLILPKINTIQNFIISKNILDKYLINKNRFNKNIFITSGSEKRISNIKEVITFFQNKNYEIIFPHKISIKELLIKIKYSKVLVSEKGSIINNIHLCRDKQYYILSSKNEIIDDNKKFVSAGIYKSLHKGLYEDIYCDDDPPYQNLIPYKKRIKVNINLLNKKLSSF